MEYNDSIVKKITEQNQDSHWDGVSYRSFDETYLDEFIGFERLVDMEVKDEVVVDSVVESVIKSFRDRSAVGYKKYGVTLDRNDLSLLDWINHAQQEAMDQILYLEKIKKEIGG